MLQVTWVAHTKNVGLKDLEMAVNKCKILHWWIPLLANPVWKGYVIWSDGLEMNVYEWKSTNGTVMNKCGKK